MPAETPPDVPPNPTDDEQPSLPGGEPWDADRPQMMPLRWSEETRREAGAVTSPDGELHWLNLSGRPAQIGRQFGERMSDAIRRGPIPIFGTFLKQFLRDSPLAEVSQVVGWATHRWVSERLGEGLTDDFREAAEAMAEAAGLSMELVTRAMTVPETFLWLVGTYHRIRGTGRARGLGRPPLAGCTSAVVAPPASDSLLHGRNLDYFGVDFWEPAATVAFYHPADGLDYVSVSSAGVLGGGITGMNAAGITIAAHQHFVDEFDLDGVPIGVAGDRVMRRARSIEEAVAVLDDHPPVAGWSYVLTEGDTGRVAVYETAPADRYVYRSAPSVDHLGYSNVFWGPTLEEAEVDFYPEYYRDVRARQTRALARTDALTDADPPATPADVADILADFTDPDTGDRRVVGRGIAAVHTVSSVVFEPAERRLWVGTGPSPASRSWFAPFRLSRPGTPGRGGPDLEATPFHPEPGWERTDHGQAYRLYRDAYRRWWDGESDKRLLIAIEHALALYPSDSNLHLLAGLLALRAGRARRAEGAFRRALERTNDLPRRAEIQLYLAWSLDLQEQRSAARHLYHKVARSPGADPSVRARAKRGRWWKFSESRAESLPVDFIHVGVP